MSEFEFQGAQYGQENYPSGSVLFDTEGFTVKVKGTEVCTHPYEIVYSIRVLSESGNMARLDMCLLMKYRKIFMFSAKLKDTSKRSIVETLMSRDQFKPIATGSTATVLVRRLEGCISPQKSNTDGRLLLGKEGITQAERSPLFASPSPMAGAGGVVGNFNPGHQQAGNNPAAGMYGAMNSHVNAEFNILYQQVAKRSLVANNFNILLEGLSSIKNIQEQEETPAIAVPIDGLDSAELFRAYIHDIKYCPNPKEGRALFECLATNLLLPSEHVCGYKTPENLEEMHMYLKNLNEQYQKQLGMWVDRGYEELTSDFTADINVIAKDVVRTEKNSKYVKADFEVFRRLRKIRWCERHAAKNIEGGNKVVPEDQNQQEIQDEEPLKESEAVQDRMGQNNPEVELDEDEDPDIIINDVDKEKEELDKILHSESNLVLLKLIRGSIVKKFLVPFFIKELIDKKFINTTAGDGASSISQMGTGSLVHVLNENPFSILDETQQQCIAYTFKSQIRMFVALVTCFVQKSSVSYVQGMNDFIGSLTETSIIASQEKIFFGMEVNGPEDLECVVYYMFREILKSHKKAFTTQSLNGSMTVLEYFGEAISEIRPPLYYAMQRTDFDSVLLYMLNPYLLFLRREVENATAMLKLLCETLRSELGYNYLFVLMLAYTDINVAPVLQELISLRTDRPEPVLSKLSCQPKVRAIELITLANRYMHDAHIRKIILDYFGKHYKP